jgi:hypothetical protein
VNETATPLQRAATWAWGSTITVAPEQGILLVLEPPSLKTDDEASSADVNKPVLPHCTWANHGKQSVGYCDPAFTSVQHIGVKTDDERAGLHRSKVPRADGIGGTACWTAEDCQYNGECHGSRCVCDAAFRGGNCALLHSLPTLGATYPAAVGTVATGAGSGAISSWGGRPVYVRKDRTWHLYVTELQYGCGMDAWKNNSVVVHAVADNVTGPFVRVGIAIPAFAHNPDDVALADGSILIFHIGDGTPNR